MSAPAQIVVGALAACSVFSVGVLGLGLNRRATGTWNMAYGSLVVASGLLAEAFIRVCGWTPWMLPIAGAAVGAFMNSLLWIVYFSRSNVSIKGSSIALVGTIGLALVIDNTLALTFGTEPRVITKIPGGVFSLWSISISLVQVAGFLSGILVLCILSSARHMLLFRLFRAIESNAELVEVSGWHIGRLRVAAMALAGAFGGLCGGFVMLDTGLDAYAGVPLTLALLAAVLVGGSRSMLGWIVGALAVTMFHACTALVFATKWADLSTFAVLVVVLLLRGNGLIHIHRRLSET